MFMGSSSYSGKGSYSSYSEPIEVRKPRTAMDDMLDLLSDVDFQRRMVNASKRTVQARMYDVQQAQSRLAEEEERLKVAEDRVMMQLGKLDPETQEKLRSMMRGLDQKNKNAIERDDR